MTIDILRLVQEKRCATLIKSMAATDRHEKKVSNIAAQVKQLLNKENQNVPLDHLEAFVARSTYYHILSEYTGTFNAQAHQTDFTPKGLALWKRVAAAINTANTDAESFVRSQFAWFHQAFKKPPEVIQLTTDAAVCRAAATAPKRVTTDNIPANVPMGDLFRRCEKHMADLMRAQSMSREEVYTKLVKNHLAMFPQSFLDVDPVWKAIK